MVALFFLSLWRTLQGDPARTGRVDFALTEGVPGVVWADTFSSVSAPVVGPDSSVYAVQQAVLYKLNALTGSVLWTDDGSAGGGGNGDITPIVSAAGDRVIFFKYYDSGWQGWVYGDDPLSGSRLWSVSLSGSGSWVGYGSAEADGFVYAPDFNNSSNGQITKIATSDGSVAWAVDVPDIGGEEDLMWIAVDTVGGKFFVGGGNSETRVHCFDTSGNYLWNYNLGASSGSMGLVDPATGNLYQPASSGLFAFSTDGSLLWHYADHGARWPLALSPSGDTLYASFDDGVLRALSAADGSVLWEDTLGASAHIAVEKNGRLVIAYSGKVAMVEPPGTHLWEVTLDTSGSAPRGMALASWGDSVWIYVSLANGVLYALTTPELERGENFGSGPEIKLMGSEVIARGRGLLEAYSGEGRLLLRRGVAGSARVSLKKMPKGIVIFKFGRSKLLMVNP